MVITRLRLLLSCKGIWMLNVGEHLSCEQEMANTEDSYAPCFWLAFTFLLLGSSGLTHLCTSSVSFDRVPHSHTGPSRRRYLSRAIGTQLNQKRQIKNSAKFSCYTIYLLQIQLDLSRTNSKRKTKDPSITLQMNHLRHAMQHWDIQTFAEALK